MSEIFWVALAGTMTGGVIAAIGFGLMVFFATRTELREDEVEILDYDRDASGKPVAARKKRIPLLRDEANPVGR
jgi:hypothetical protein